MQKHGKKPYLYTKRFTSAVPCDVLVVGGGIAGVTAAISAARAGAKTVLLEKLGFLGGTITTWGQVCFSGDSAGQGEVFDELMRMMLEAGATDPYVPFEAEKILEFDHADSWQPAVARRLDSEWLRVILARMVSVEKNLDTRLHVHAADAVPRKGAVEAVLVSSAFGLEMIEPGFVIDCTGDAHVASAAGFACMEGLEKGRPVPMAMRLTLRRRPEDAAGALNLPDWAGTPTREIPSGMVHLTKNEGDRGIFRMNVTGLDPLKTDELSEAELTSQENVPRALEYLRNHGYPEYVLDSLSTSMGIRIGRRIIGNKILTVADVRKGASFGDAVARGTCNLTSSYLDPEKTARAGKNLEVEVVPPYQIPFRSLVPRDGVNLLAAGRCISADAWAVSSARMIPACAMTGQAAGLAAAQCAAAGTSVAKVDIGKLQQELRRKGAEF